MAATERKEARRQLRERRTAMGEAGRALAARAIAERLEGVVKGLRLRVIAGYWAMKDEPDLAALMARWHDAGLQVVLPRVVAADAPLEFAPWRPGGRLVEGPFGTLHPDDPRSLRPDLLVIPCLGFDARCYRLGYGGGYYDRTLERLAPVQTVGVAYDRCEVSGFAAHVHDLPMDWVVTERRVLPRPRDRR